MKPFYLLCAVCVLAVTGLRAQDSDDFYTVSGTVRDERTRAPLELASVALSGTRVGTVTNADGYFSLKIKTAFPGQTLEISRLGYITRRLSVESRDRAGMTIFLAESSFPLSPVVVGYVDPRKLVEQAVGKIELNYADRPTMLTGFYRETVQKRQHYIEVSEAVTQVYKTSYEWGTGDDRTRIVKGRTVVSTSRRDTLSVKLLGGPAGIVNYDFVKARSEMLDRQVLDYYALRMTDPVSIDERAQYVVEFYPRGIIPDDLMFHGRFYIDMQTMAFSRIEASVDMSDKQKVTGVVLRRKPPSLRFSPEEISFILSYNTRNGRSYLSYMQNRLGFRCDWKRRLFSTGYTVVSEIVITDGTEDNVVAFPYREAFRSDHMLSDRIVDFYDPGFWEDYNIIEPSQSLENAVGRLRKQHE